MLQLVPTYTNPFLELHRPGITRIVHIRIRWYCCIACSASLILRCYPSWRIYCSEVNIMINAHRHKTIVYGRSAVSLRFEMFFIVLNMLITFFFAFTWELWPTIGNILIIIICISASGFVILIFPKKIPCFILQLPRYRGFILLFCRLSHLICFIRSWFSCAP